jgi:chromosomal replication initiation ATPase DnaA
VEVCNPNKDIIIHMTACCVADVFSVDSEELMGERQFIDIVQARRFLWYILNKSFNFDVEYLSEYFNKCDTSIIFGIKNIQKSIDHDDNALRDYFLILVELKKARLWKTK